MPALLGFAVTPEVLQEFLVIHHFGVPINVDNTVQPLCCKSVSRRNSSSKRVPRVVIPNHIAFGKRKIPYPTPLGKSLIAGGIDGVLHRKCGKPGSHRGCLEVETGPTVAGISVLLGVAYGARTAVLPSCTDICRAYENPSSSFGSHVLPQYSGQSWLLTPLVSVWEASVPINPVASHAHCQLSEVAEAFDLL